MNKLVICTTGTSIATSVKDACPALGEMNSRDTHWDEDASELRSQIQRILDDPSHNLDDDTWRRKSSAEMNSLDRLHIQPDDVVVLLATDTAQGRVCSELVGKCIKQVFGCTVRLERIEGLQVQNNERLRREGLSNFVKVVRRYLTDPQYEYAYERILNPTGGFKGVVPFLSTLGMLYRVPTVYIFEFSEELIYLPPLPLAFDLRLYERVKPALRLIEQEVAVSEAQFLNHIRDYREEERDLFMSFTENYEGQLTNSPLAYCLLDQDQIQPTLLVSPLAKRQLEEAEGQVREMLHALADKAREPLWLSVNRHTFHGTDLLVFKQGRTRCRLAGFFHAHQFHLTHAFGDHDDYEQILRGTKRTQFNPADFVAWAPSEPPQDYTLLEGELLHDLETRVHELERTLKERDAAQHDVVKKQVAHEIKPLQKEIHRLRGEVSRKDREISELKRQPAADDALGSEETERPLAP